VTSLTVKAVEAGILPFKSKINVKGSGQECPLHTIKNPHFSQRTREMVHPDARHSNRLSTVSSSMVVLDLQEGKRP
jgi:hypothetical protein